MSHESLRRYGDQYHCDKCSKQWDIDDTDPPECIEPESLVDKLNVMLEECEPETVVKTSTAEHIQELRDKFNDTE